jgi:ATP-dependent RNA helicase DeaD
MNFSDFNLSEPINQALSDLGYQNPTPIQAQTLPLLISEQTDIVALAQTGTGKTAAFGLPLIQRWLSDKNQKTSALILSPTRELCLQITNELKNFSKYLEDIRIMAVYGGTSIERQLDELKKTPHIVCATPGRLMDIFERKKIDLSEIEVLVLDEADEMLNMGFRDDIEQIIKISNPNKNIWMFSATMPTDVEKLAKKYLNHPKKIQAGNVNVTASAIEHHAYRVKNSEKFDALKRVLDYYPDSYGIIFCRTKTDTQKLSDELVQMGYSADALHGDLTQSQREWVMKRFRKKSVRMLVATDVAARGIDVDNLTHVIHYQLPDNPEVYTHRSGRTARAGKSGISVSFVSSRDEGKYKEIQRVCKFKAEDKKIPTVNEILQKQAEFKLKKILSQHENPQTNYLELLPEEVRSMLSSVSKEDFVLRFLDQTLSELADFYKKKPERLSSGKADSGSSSKKAVFRINFGKYDGLDFALLKKKLADWTNIKEKNFYVVELKNTYSYVEVPRDLEEKLLALNEEEIQIKGRSIRIERRSGTENVKTKTNADSDLFKKIRSRKLTKSRVFESHQE